MSASTIIRLVPIIVGLLGAYGPFRAGLVRLDGGDAPFAFYAPVDPAGLWVAYLLVTLLLLGLAAWLIYGELRPTRVEAPAEPFHANKSILLEVLMAIGSLFMLSLGAMVVVDGFTRHNAGVGVMIGCLTLPLGLFLTLYRSWAIVDPARRLVRVLIGWPRALFSREVPFDDINGVDLVQVVNQYGQTRAWRVQASRRSGKRPVVLHASFGEGPAVEAAARLRQLFGLPSV
jgi:hypothetical protein